MSTRISCKGIETDHPDGYVEHESFRKDPERRNKVYDHMRKTGKTSMEGDNVSHICRKIDEYERNQEKRIEEIRRQQYKGNSKYP